MSESNSISKIPIKNKRRGFPIPTSTETIFITTNEATASNIRQVGFSPVYAAINTNNQVPKDIYEKNRDTPFVLLLDYDGFETILEKTIKCFDSLDIRNDWEFLYLSPRGMTWNDLYHNGLLSPDKQKATLEKAYLQGKLHAAKSEQDYFRIYRDKYPETTTLIFEFNHRLVKVSLKKPKTSSTDQEDELEVNPLTDCSMLFEHSIIDETKKNKRYHHLLLYSEREGLNRIKLTDNDFTQTNLFIKTLQQGRQIFYGNNKDLTELRSYLLASQPPKIRALATIG